MSTLYEVLNLRKNMVSNMDYLKSNYPLIDEILVDLDRIINLDMSHSDIFYWWYDNEDSINTIDQLIKNIKE